MIFKEKCICSIPCSILKGGCKSAVKSIVCGLRSDSNPLTHVLNEGRNSLKNKGFDFFVLKFTPVLFGVICKLLQKTKTLMKQIKENLYSIWIHISA